jgi:hypothetical protein
LMPYQRSISVSKAKKTDEVEGAEEGETYVGALVVAVAVPCEFNAEWCVALVDLDWVHRKRNRGSGREGGEGKGEWKDGAESGHVR